MSPQIPEENEYPVEVSGWDSVENFFVEKTLLHWDQKEGKTILLRTPLREGAIVFLRLSQSSSRTNSIPIAYQAKRIELPDNQGLARVFLVRLLPRYQGEDAFSEALIESLPDRP